MGAVIVYLLPLIVGAALLPAWIILALFLLRGEGGVRKALAFAAGAMTVRLTGRDARLVGTQQPGDGDRGSVDFRCMASMEGHCRLNRLMPVKRAYRVVRSSWATWC